MSSCPAPYGFTNSNNFRSKFCYSSFSVKSRLRIEELGTRATSRIHNIGDQINPSILSDTPALITRPQKQFLDIQHIYVSALALCPSHGAAPVIVIVRCLGLIVELHVIIRIPRPVLLVVSRNKCPLRLPSSALLLSLESPAYVDTFPCKQFMIF